MRYLRAAFDTPVLWRAPCREQICRAKACRGSNTIIAREARLELEQLERLLVKRHAVKNFRPFRRFRLLVFSVSGTARRGDRNTGSPSDRRPRDMSAPLLASRTTAAQCADTIDRVRAACHRRPGGPSARHAGAPPVRRSPKRAIASTETENFPTGRRSSSRVVHGN